MGNRFRKAFTLVEILIVVVILGILAAIAVPQFASAASDAKRTAVADQVGKLRRMLSVYYARNSNAYPTITDGDGTWGELIVDVNGEGTYMRQPPANVWVGGSNARVIVLRDTPDTAFQTDYGWIYSPTTGDVWAGGCDGDDVPFDIP